MITRTVTITKATVLCVNTVAEETVTQVVEVPRTYTDDSKLLKQFLTTETKTKSKTVTE